MRIDLPVPKPFFVITAKDEHNRILCLQDIHSIYTPAWSSLITEYTKKFDDKASAEEIKKIQNSSFPEQNKNLSCFKVRKVKVAYIFE